MVAAQKTSADRQPRRTGTALALMTAAFSSVTSWFIPTSIIAVSLMPTLPASCVKILAVMHDLLGMETA
jgi:hypothetical protein